MTASWYVIHVHSGAEKRVSSSIREMARKKGIEDHFEEIFVPAEEVTEVKRGRRVNSERKFFPGYVLLKMEMSAQTENLVRTTNKVTGFLGPDNKPQAISDDEAERIMGQVQEVAEKPRPVVTFVTGENIRVADGPFSSFSGTVEEVDESKGRLKVSVSIFGRQTPVELEYSQVEKL